MVVWGKSTMMLPSEQRALTFPTQLREAPSNPCQPCLGSLTSSWNGIGVMARQISPGGSKA